MNAHEKGIEKATEVISAAHAYQLSYEAVEAGLRAYLEASGMVMVPKEPTPKMLHEAAKAMSPGKRPTEDWVSVSKKHAIRYSAMIEAFPGPFSQANTEGEG